MENKDIAKKIKKELEEKLVKLTIWNEQPEAAVDEYFAALRDKIDLERETRIAATSPGDELKLNSLNESSKAILDVLATYHDKALKAASQRTASDIADLQTKCQKLAQRISSVFSEPDEDVLLVSNEIEAEYESIILEIEAETNRLEAELIKSSFLVVGFPEKVRPDSLLFRGYMQMYIIESIHFTEVEQKYFLHYFIYALGCSYLESTIGNKEDSKLLEEFNANFYDIFYVLEKLYDKKRELKVKMRREVTKNLIILHRANHYCNIELSSVNSLNKYAFSMNFHDRLMEKGQCISAIKNYYGSLILCNANVSIVRPDAFGYDRFVIKMMLNNNCLKQLDSNIFYSTIGRENSESWKEDEYSEKRPYWSSRRMSSSDFEVDTHHVQMGSVNPEYFELYLNENEIEEIDKDFFSCNLGSARRLYLDSNNLRRLPRKCFEYLKNLEELSISNNLLSLDNGTEFVCLHNLSSLVLGSNKIQSLEPFELMNSPNLKLLTLKRNRIKVFDHSLEGLKSLESVDLSSNKIKRIILDSTGSITDFNFSKNFISEFTMSDVDSLTCKIVQLDLSNNYLTSFDFKGLSQLEILKLAHNRIRSLSSLQANESSKLKYLDLSSNELKEIHKPIAFEHLKNLKTLVLAGNQINKIEPNAFANLSLLVNLNMNSCELVDLETDFFNCLTNLTDLHLKSNQISKLHRNCFGSLSSLKKLDLSKNKIETLNEDMFDGLSSLWSLNLSDNKLKSVNSTCFAKLYQLSQLDLSENGLGGLETQLYAELPELENRRNCSSEKSSSPSISEGELLQINMKSCSQLKIDSSAWQILRNFQNFSFLENKLTKLKICNHNQETFDDVIFENLTKLEKLDVSFNQLEHLESHLLFKSLLRLKELKLNNNAIRTLNKKLFTDLDRLSSLSLAFNQIEHIDDFQFRFQDSLTSLELNNNKLSKLNMPILLGHVRSLQKLDLSNNSLNDDSFDEAAINNLPFTVKLKELTLDHNQLTKIGFVKRFYRLTTLTLSFNKIERLQDEDLFEDLCSLESLDISHNAIADVKPGVLKKLPYLTSFKFEANPIGLKAFDYLQ